jgi:hypothetical protein
LPRIEPAVALNVDLSTISAATEVAIGFGSPLQEIADLNFQSGPDTNVDARVLLYNVALHFRFKVPVRTLLILLRPKADSKSLTGKLTYVAGNSSVEFNYEVVRMWQQPIEPFLRGGLHLLPLATLCQLPADRPIADALRDIVMEIDRRLAQECEYGQAVRLMTAAFILTGLRVEREAIAPIFSGVRVMHESTAFDYYVEEGLRKGLEQGLSQGLSQGLEQGLEQGLSQGLSQGLEQGLSQGLEQGREQGLSQGLVAGVIRGKQELLLSLGRKLLGQPDPATVVALQAIKDADRLERLALTIVNAISWQELLATP